ncbi:MAG: peptidoglycan editing factor PgeF [Cyanobacteriota bacterium]|nr:peptidoglycan editing factor PgeF [Cyanobacteriota bacterium]
MAGTWQWQQQGLTCSLLADWPHWFGSKLSYPALPAQLVSHWRQDPASAIWVHQVHGNHYLASDQVIAMAEQPQADALVAHPSSSHSVWVSTADCVPILLASPTGLVAAVHAGWRGTAAQILGQVIQAFVEQGSPLHSLRAALGPAISGEVYQVSQEVADQVLQTIPSTLHSHVLYPDPNPGKVCLDVRQVNRLQLIASGIPAEQISLAPYCTLRHSDYFFSYRRQGSLRSGPNSLPTVQWSGIGFFPEKG